MTYFFQGAKIRKILIHWTKRVGKMHFFLHYSRYNTAEISFICQMFFRFDRADYLALLIRSIFGLYLVFIGCLISVGSTLLQSLSNRYPIDTQSIPDPHRDRGSRVGQGRRVSWSEPCFCSIMYFCIMYFYIIGQKRGDFGRFWPEITSFGLSVSVFGGETGRWQMFGQASGWARFTWCTSWCACPTEYRPTSCRRPPGWGRSLRDRLRPET